MMDAVHKLFYLPLDSREFLVALGLLLLPLPLLFGKGVQYRELDRPWENYVKALLLLPWQWVDLARGAVGTWLLIQVLGVSRSIEQPSPLPVMMTLAVVLVLSVVLQTVACKHPQSFYAPFGMVIGITVVLYPPALTALALIGGVMLGFAARSFAAFFVTLPIALVVLGYWLYPNWIMLGVGATLGIVPLLLPLMFFRDLVLAHWALPPAE